MTERTDILVIGGGLVGASLAIALDAAGCDATLVEAAAPKREPPPRYSERNLALARATVNGLRSLGVWPHAEAAATPIRRIHVSRVGEFGSARLDAAEAGVDAVGWTLPARELGHALQLRLDACTALRRRAPATVRALQPVEDGWLARIDDADGERELHARLLVGADGTASMVRDALGIEADTHDYAQTLFVCTVTPERPLRGCAYERFSDDGPVALLPLTDDRAGLVMTVAADEAERVSALDDEAYIALAQQRFGWRAGRLRQPGMRFAHPIRRAAARRVVGPRAVLVGNAAQTIHPIGAQGFNLGLRDALTLAECVIGAADPGDADLLHAYAERRAPDREGVMAMSHGLIRLACLPQPWLGPLRSLGLLSGALVPPLRDALVRHGMGFRGQPPRAVLEQVP
ncbi:2-octaprenyl-6-methoxyphenyl hydroxylase [Oleiagrimonas soli]|uniref:2-octaprenyl-6-methoxyphenol hydroxylase n=1 Tax=Oleiagrimonas soli TaxID=1543381 RepID=A0A099CTH3_9GAMM|nr:2-octaprenyl-6-methoxyphenyl hydroxylase [Oleiagrimonas soli]KGI77044.1 2-octaprenyl-6-methoxyphenyl hydroxylase [Oleiagrimonas soli]MBB6185432.1 2-octaprenyl-6-methoxyphenol hydroxylase [Oleiagrimonas soli]